MGRRGQRPLVLRARASLFPPPRARPRLRRPPLPRRRRPDPRPALSPRGLAAPPGRVRGGVPGSRLPVVSGPQRAGRGRRRPDPTQHVRGRPLGHPSRVRGPGAPPAEPDRPLALRRPPRPLRGQARGRGGRRKWRGVADGLRRRDRAVRRRGRFAPPPDAVGCRPNRPAQGRGGGVAHELPGVGQNVRDHPHVGALWRPKLGYPMLPDLPRYQIALRYTAPGSPLRNDPKS